MQPPHKRFLLALSLGTALLEHSNDGLAPSSHPEASSKPADLKQRQLSSSLREPLDANSCSDTEQNQHPLSKGHLASRRLQLPSSHRRVSFSTTGPLRSQFLGGKGGAKWQSPHCVTLRGGSWASSREMHTHAQPMHIRSCGSRVGRCVFCV